tara:strand:+ start:2511 stop:2879 length:369 start_codon:yes stop_codon:yes gene_type:complete
MTESEKKKTQSAIDIATGHFKDRLAGDMLCYHCEEWDMDIYYKATASLMVENKIMSLQQQGKTAEALVESIIAKALNKDGKKLFKTTDVPEFLHSVDPNVIIKVATKLNNASADTVEEIGKN